MKSSIQNTFSSMILDKISKLYLVSIKSHINVYLELLSRNNYIKTSALDISKTFINRVIEQTQLNISSHKQQFINYLSSQFKQHYDKALSPKIQRQKKENKEIRYKKEDQLKSENAELNKMLRMLMQKVITIQNKNIELQKTLLKNDSQQYSLSLKKDINRKQKSKDRLISQYSKQYKEIKSQIATIKQSLSAVKQQIRGIKKNIKMQINLFAEEWKNCLLNSHKISSQLINNLTISKRQLKKKKDDLKYELKLQKSLECLQWKSPRKLSSARSLSEYKIDQCDHSKQKSIVMDIERQIKIQQQKLKLGMKEIGTRRKNFQIL